MLAAMFTSRCKMRVAWIALVAVLYAASSPLLAALRFQGQPDVLAAICTLDGIRPVSGQPALPAQRGAQRQLHCVFCVSGAWQPALDVPLTVPAPASAAILIFVPRESVQPRFSATLQPLNPRAPPRIA